MARRHKIWARKVRRLWLEILGHRCNWPGCTETDADKLTFDCIIPQGDTHHRWSTDQRMTFYIRQALAGNIQLLCERHNSMKKNKETNGDWLRVEQVATKEQDPF